MKIADTVDFQANNSRHEAAAFRRQKQ